MDPFSLLGIEPTFSLDVKALDKQHRELSRALHPDKYTNAGAGERQMALGKAIEVNEAARALKDPIRRAEALFARAGVATGETSEPKPSPLFLMTILDEREALSEASEKRDRAAIEALARSIRARGEAAEANLAAGFAAAGAASASSATAKTTNDAPNDAPEAPALSALLPQLGELRFYRRFLDEVRAQLDRLDTHDASSGG